MKRQRLLGYLCLVVCACLTLTPLFFLLSTSLKSNAETNMFPPTLWPRHFLWSNYAEVFRRFAFGRYLFNTLVISLSSVLGTVLSTSLVAWGFARYPGRWNNVFSAILLSTLMLPGQITAIPIFAMYVRLGFYNTYVPLIFPAWLGFNAFNVFLLRQFFMKLPADLLNAARIDGASEWQVFYKVALPLCKPVLLTLAVLNLVGSWNDYFTPLVYLNDEKLYPISLGLTYFKQASSSAAFSANEWPLMMAASLITIIPVVVLFFLAQRSFINSVMSSALKE